MPKPLHGPASKSRPKPPSTDGGKMTPQDRRAAAKAKAISTVYHQWHHQSLTIAVHDKRKRRRRNETPRNSLASWTEENRGSAPSSRQRVQLRGRTSLPNWRACAAMFAPKALHTRYLREIGRIVDRPRGQDQLLQQQSASSNTKMPATSKKHVVASKLVVRPHSCVSRPSCICT